MLAHRYLATIALALAGCTTAPAQHALTCGEGTVERSGVCLAASAPVACGTGTVLEAGACVCGARSAAVDPPPGVPDPGAAAPGVRSIEVGRVAGEEETHTPARIVAPTDTVYVSMSLGNVTNAQPLTTRWYHEGKLIDEPDPAGKVTSYEVTKSKSPGWEPGAYRVDVLLAGQPASSVEFQVK